ncbi:penicillin-binding protein PBP2B [Streptococcus salivarius]|uniref:penicillin-binding protein PBP2B n=1 Tax=Streptococcus salivarius TaxID=1304 RepID=UPI001604BECD|nr:penicillin-binding protein PBP2B [Streptococcus salivarius]
MTSFSKKLSQKWEKRRQKQKEKRANKPRKPVNISRRVYLLFGVVFVLFLLLFARLTYMQVYNKSFYTKKLEDNSKYTVRIASERGQIFDAKGVALTTNQSKDVITFTRSNLVSSDTMKKVAEKLATMVTLTETKVTARQKRDFYLADSATYKRVVNDLPKDKKTDKFGNKLAEATIYNNAVDAVPDEAVDYTEDELKIVYIYSQMNAVSNFSTVTLKTGDLTPEQIAIVAAKQKELNGITVAKDWERHTVDSALSPLIGKVSSSEAGLPQEDAKEYLKKGYALNDRVGTSYLEKEYEEKLQGKHTVREITVDKEGEVASDKITQKGSKGNNLQLTIDLDFQKGVEDILGQQLSSEISENKATYSEGMYAVVMNADTGAVLAMAGQKHEQGAQDFKANALGTITDVFIPGSVVKGATLTAGWRSGAIYGNQVLTDQPINIAGSAPITSWFTDQGSRAITATQALEYSSNTYMVQIAIKLLGQQYVPGMALSTDNMDKAMTTLRDTYADFGMGVSTGLDLPGESEGYISKNYNVANVLTEAFGQYDSYTTIQLAQYVASIANGGKRVAPHIVGGIYDAGFNGSLGTLASTVDTRVLNTLPLDSEQMGIIQQGFNDVVNSGSSLATGKAMASSIIPISGKTGTAETYATDASGNSVTTVNLNAVAYATAKDGTKLAVGIMYPHALDWKSKAHQNAVKAIMELYQNTH